MIFLDHKNKIYDFRRNSFLEKHSNTIIDPYKFSLLCFLNYHIGTNISFEHRCIYKSVIILHSLIDEFYYLKREARKDSEYREKIVDSEDSDDIDDIDGIYINKLKIYN